MSYLALRLDSGQDGKKEVFSEKDGWREEKIEIKVEELEALKKRIKSLEEWRERNTDDGR